MSNRRDIRGKVGGRAGKEREDKRLPQLEIESVCGFFLGLGD